MTSFCTKCGASISPTDQFCTVCGTSVASGPPVITPFQPVTASSSSGGSAVKIIVIVLAVFVGLGILAAAIFGYGVWRVSKALHVESSNGNVTVQTPEGKVTANTSETFMASDLGVDVYPGAQTGKGSIRMDMPNGSMTTGVFVTSDSKAKVVDFYKLKLGSEASVMDMQDTAIVSMTKNENESVMVTITAKSSDNDGKTQVAIVHTTGGRT